MMPCVDDYVYDDPTLAKNSSAESFGFGTIVSEKEKERESITNAKGKELEREKEEEAEKLDLDKVLEHVYNPMKQGGIKGMEKGSLAMMRNKYNVSPFKRASPKAIKKGLNVNALSFDPTKLNPNATAFNPLNPEVQSFKMPPQTIKEEEEEAQEDEEGVYRSPFSGPSSTERVTEPNYNNDATILALHGFRKIKKMEDSLQGMLVLTVIICT